MTPTSPSTLAGTEPRDRAVLLAGWVRRAAAAPAAATWVLRGSLVTAALCPGARVPADVDYLVPGHARDFDPAAIERVVRELADLHDPTTRLAVTAVEVIFAETLSPGLRAHLVGDADDMVQARFQIDLAIGDPMCVPARPMTIAGVDGVLACAPETLFGWKLHGLCEYGRGKWRAKDLYDLDLLWRCADLERETVCAAVALAFSSRGTSLTELDDFRTRASWGQSRGGVRKWRSLTRSHPTVDEFVATRDRVRAAIDVVLAASPCTT